jgi:hypothetical protein
MTVVDFSRHRRGPARQGMRLRLSVLQDLLREFGGRQQTLRLEGHRLRESVTRLRHLTDRMIHTQRRLDASLRRLRAVHRKLPGSTA